VTELQWEAELLGGPLRRRPRGAKHNQQGNSAPACSSIQRVQNSLPESLKDSLHLEHLGEEHVCGSQVEPFESETRNKAPLLCDQPTARRKVLIGQIQLFCRASQAILFLHQQLR
jgi:hypothetical protein